MYSSSARQSAFSVANMRFVKLNSPQTVTSVLVRLVQACFSRVAPNAGSGQSETAVSCCGTTYFLGKEWKSDDGLQQSDNLFSPPCSHKLAVHSKSCGNYIGKDRIQQSAESSELRTLPTRAILGMHTHLVVHLSYAQAASIKHDRLYCAM